MTLHTLVHEQLIQFYKGFKHDAHPMAIMVSLLHAYNSGAAVEAPCMRFAQHVTNHIRCMVCNAVLLSPFYVSIMNTTSLCHRQAGRSAASAPMPAHVDSVLVIQGCCKPSSEGPMRADSVWGIRQYLCGPGVPKVGVVGALSAFEPHASDIADPRRGCARACA